MPQVYGKGQTLAPPTAVADGAQIQIRTSRYGEQYTVPVGTGTYAPVAEGTYFKATNPTFGTPVAASIAAATAFAETAASFVIRNTAAAGGKDIYIDYLHFWVAGAPTGNTTWDLAVQMDNANRVSSGALTPTVVNTNNGSATASIANVAVGPIVTTAAVSARKLGLWRLKAAIPAVADEILLNFGSVDTVVQAPGVAKALCPGPVYLPAGSNHSCLIHLFGAAQSAAPTIHFDMGWIER